MTTPTLGPGRSPGQQDGELLQECLFAVARGDHAAFTTLYRALFAHVRAVARYTVRNDAWAEDVAQDVIVHIWLCAHRYQPDRGTVTGWATTITRRRAIDHLRHRTVATRSEHHAAQLAYTPAQDTVPDDIERRLTARDIRRALEDLTPLQRAAVELAYYQGMSYPQAAHHLAIPLTTFKSRIHTAHTHLRQHHRTTQEQQKDYAGCHRQGPQGMTISMTDASTTTVTGTAPSEPDRSAFGS